MAFVLCEFFHGRNAIGVPNQCQELQTAAPHSPFSHTTQRSPFTVPSYICDSQPASASEQACVLPLIKQNMLVRFFTETYFTTFLTLQLQEDQTSSVIFSCSPILKCGPQRESLSLSLSFSHAHTRTHRHTHRHTQTETQGGGWEQRGNYISKEQLTIFPIYQLYLYY